MKKILLFLSLVTLGTSFTFAGDFERMVRSISPEAILSMGLAGFLVFLGIILSYVAISYGIYLLSRKYAPKMHPAWSWIPVAQIYPLVAVTGQSLWWIAVILLGQFIPILGPIIVLASIIFIYYSLAKKLKRGVGTTILLVFFSVIMIPYLGLEAQGKSTTPAWVLGLVAMILLFIGGGFGAVGIGRAMIGLNGQYDLVDRVRGKMMREINKNPELQKQFQALKNEFQENDGSMIKIEKNADISGTAE